MGAMTEQGVSNDRNPGVSSETEAKLSPRFAPIFGWLPAYQTAWLAADIVAGLTLWGLVVPEAMAYAGVAGLPPQAGLYTLLAALLLYAVFGTSRHLVVQATSATAALIASSVAAALIASAGANASDPRPTRRTPRRSSWSRAWSSWWRASLG